MAVDLQTFLQRKTTGTRPSAPEQKKVPAAFVGEDTGARIRQAPERTTTQKVDDFFRGNPITRPLVEGLFGIPEGERIAFEKEEADIETQAKNRGVLGFFYSGFLKSQYEQVRDRYNNLTKEGIDPRRATKVAVNDVLQKRKTKFELGVPPTEQERKEDEIQLTAKEKSVLRKAGLFETGEKALETLDFLSLGVTAGIRKAATPLTKKALRELIETTSEGAAKKIIKNALPKAPDNLVDDLARASLLAGNEDEVAEVFANPRLFLQKKKAVFQEAPEKVTDLQNRFGNVDLQGDLKSVEGRAFKELEGNGLARKTDEYLKNNGNVVAPDEARELFPEYRANRSMSVGVHEPASLVAKNAYARLLRTQKGVGDNSVLFAAGGTGAGKTSGLRAVQGQINPAVVYDSNLKSVGSSVEKIEQALENGYDVKLAFVYRDPIVALREGVLPRAEKIGRTVPLAAHIDTHVTSARTMTELMEMYKGNPKVQFRVIDNSGKAGQARLVDDPVDFLRGKLYNKGNEQRLKKQAERVLEAEFKAGRVSKQNYEATKGLRSGIRRQPQPERVGRSREIVEQGFGTQKARPGVEPSGRFDLRNFKEGEIRVKSAKAALREFDSKGSVIIAQRSDGVRLVAKDEGDFVKVGMDTGGLVDTEVAKSFPERTFATKEEAFGFVQDIIGRGKTPILKNTAPAKSIEEGVSATIPRSQNRLKGEVSQELRQSEIVSSLPESKHGQDLTSIAKEYAEYKKQVSGLRGLWTGIREKVQSSFIRVKKLQAAVEKGGAIPDDLNIDQARTLFHGRVHERMQDVRKAIVDVDRDIVASAKKLKTKADDLTEEVNRYLWVRHAPERNARLGDEAAGITTAEAKKALAEIEKSANAAEIKRLADRVADLNKQTLDILLEGEVIDRELYDLLHKTYKNHVPLQRVFGEEDDIIEVLSGKGFDVRGTGLKRAVGSKREVADIMTNVVANVEQAIIRAEKNLVDLTTLRFARAHKELGLFEEVKPRAIGRAFAKEGEEGRILLQQVTDPTVLALRVKGKPVFLRINDKRLAVALKGVNVERMPAMIRGIASLTRLYAGLHTRFNYEFAFSNNIRDVQEMMVYAASRKEMGFGAAGKAAAKDVSSKKAVFDFIFGRDTEGAKLYKQMRLDGGTTGGLGLSTREQVQLDIDKIRKLNRSNTRKAAETAIEVVDKWNTLFEDASRLSVYRTALDRGATRKQAATLAKRATIDFNEKGTAGPIINGMYMFSNASIQGTTKILGAMKNPKVAGAVIGSVGASVYAANQWNDSVDPDWRNKVTKWDRSSNMVIMLPTDDEGANYITIPISWGLKPVKVSLEYVYDAATGHGDLQDATQGVLTSVFEAYNPLAGDEDILNTLTPTVLKTPVEIARNRAWYGNPIKPDFDPNVPASAKYFRSLENTLIGRGAIKGTAKVSEMTGGAIELNPADVEYAANQYMGGVGRSISKIISAVSAIGPAELAARERPVLSRFVKDRSEEEVLKSLYYSEKEKVDKEKAREKVEDTRRITPLYEEAQMLLEEGKEDEAQALVNGLSDDDYEIYKKIKASDKRRKTTADQIDMFSTVLDVQKLLDNGKKEEAQRVVNEMTDEQYKVYKSVKEQLGLE